MLTAIWDFLFHRHEWEIIKETTLVDDDRNPVGTAYYFQCTKCNAIKRKKLW